MLGDKIYVKNFGSIGKWVFFFGTDRQNGEVKIKDLKTYGVVTHKI